MCSKLIKLKKSENIGLRSPKIIYEVCRIILRNVTRLIALSEVNGLCTTRTTTAYLIKKHGKKYQTDLKSSDRYSRA